MSRYSNDEVQDSGAVFKNCTVLTPCVVKISLSGLMKISIMKYLGHYQDHH
jgi:hypothetical protein